MIPGEAVVLLTIPAPGALVNIFTPGSDLLLHSRNVTGKLEVLMAADLNANVIQSVNLLVDTFWNQWEKFFSLGFSLEQLSTAWQLYNSRKRAGI